MKAQETTIGAVDEYIEQFPKEVQKPLRQIRAAIKRAAPDATERISYRMPTYTGNGNLVHFAGHRNHIGFYPTPSGIDAFKKQLSPYEGSKGSVRFPLEKPLPLDLIERIVKFRVEEDKGKAAPKSRRS